RSPRRSLREYKLAAASVPELRGASHIDAREQRDNVQHRKQSMSLTRRVAAQEVPRAAGVAQILVPRFLNEFGAEGGHGVAPHGLDLLQRVLVSVDGGKHDVVE